MCRVMRSKPAVAAYQLHTYGRFLKNTLILCVDRNKPHVYVKFPGQNLHIINLGKQFDKFIIGKSGNYIKGSHKIGKREYDH